MSAFPATDLAALSRPFIFAAEPLLKKLGSIPKLAPVKPASRLDARPMPEMVSSGIPALDALTAGWPRGCLSEICGPASSGRTGILLAALAASTERGEICALVDAEDTLHPASAKAAGIDMAKMLWVRCGGTCRPQRSASMREKKIGRGWEARLEQALKVTDLLLQSNGFGMIALDLGDIPAHNARRIPLASWFRFRRAVEHTPTALLVVEQQPIAGSCSSVLMKVSGRRSQVGKKLSAASSQLSADRPAHAELFDKFEITAELLRTRLDRKPMQSVIASFHSRSAWAG